MKREAKDKGYASIAKDAQVTATVFSFADSMRMMRIVCDASRTEIWPSLSGNEIHVLCNLAAQEAIQAKNTK